MSGEVKKAAVLGSIGSPPRYSPGTLSASSVRNSRPPRSSMNHRGKTSLCIILPRRRRFARPVIGKQGQRCEVEWRATVNRKVHAGFGPAAEGSTRGKPRASASADWHYIKVRGRGKLTRLRPPHPSTREERPAGLQHRSGAVVKTLSPKTRSSFAPDNRRFGFLMLRACGRPRLATTRRPGADRHAARWASRDLCSGERSSALYALVGLTCTARSIARGTWSMSC